MVLVRSWAEVTVGAETVVPVRLWTQVREAVIESQIARRHVGFELGEIVHLRRVRRAHDVPQFVQIRRVAVPM